MKFEGIKIKGGRLPDEPGVYLYYDRFGKLLYVGKATSLARRVGSYFSRPLEARIEEMVGQIARIDYIQTPTVIEALVLEANEISARRPKYNILGRDDKTFLYLAITNENFPRPLLIRGHELRQMGVNPLWDGRGKVGRKFLRVFGPYTSGRSLKMALDIIRRTIPWSICSVPPPARGGARGGGSGMAKGRRPKPCFDSQIGKCPGVCVGAIHRADYRRIIRQLILFFEGKKSRLVRELKHEMDHAAKQLDFEDAAVLRRRLFALEHIRDIALISREDHELPFTRSTEDGTVNLLGRIEAYDISNISGTSAVGSMVVFEDGKPAKDKYRRFKIKTVKGVNDVAMLEEVMRRRLARISHLPDLSTEALAKVEGGLRGVGVQRSNASWELPDLMIIDGGEPQVNRVQAILEELGVCIPIVGIAKGSNRKQDRLVFDRGDEELLRVAVRGKELFQRARDEAHRFAIQYHRKLRSRNSLSGQKKKKAS